jgi:hypothetical protein
MDERALEKLCIEREGGNGKEEIDNKPQNRSFLFSYLKARENHILFSHYSKYENESSLVGNPPVVHHIFYMNFEPILKTEFIDRTKLFLPCLKALENILSTEMLFDSFHVIEDSSVKIRVKSHTYGPGKMEYFAAYLKD